VTDIPERGLSRSRAATEEERVELARELDIPSCESLSVTYELKPRRPAGHFTFTGNLEADVTQACVVTLDPVPAKLSETFTIDLGPPDALDEAHGTGDDERIVSSVPDIEPIEDGRIDVGTTVFGILSAVLPQYPRKPGVEFDWVDPKADGEQASPFAALAKLKPKP
jgi:uncharacterized metal-binding protein YceD (DUF177 family)